VGDNIGPHSIAEMNKAREDAPPPPPPETENVQFTPPATTEEAVSTEQSQTIIENGINKKKIIKDGNISIKVKNIEEAKKHTDALLKKYNSYYEHEDLQNTSTTITYTLKARIPSNNFERLLALVENGTGEVTSKSIQARDVTEEFVDITTRLKNKKLYLDKYNSLLNKAGNVKDILAIEENIRMLQEEIESTQGRLKYLNDQVDFSTLNITLFQEKEYVYKPQEQDSFAERLKNSLHNGWTGFIDLILWFVANWPLILVLIVIIAVIRRLRRKKDKS
jgi:ribonuclease HIII